MSRAVRSPFSSEEPKSGQAPIGASSYATTGVLINGKYRVEQLLGEGGVGIVVAATNIELGERVALKFLKEEMLDNSEVVGRFMHEAKAACTIKSEHSATVYDVGRTPQGVPFLVMEFLEGQDLSRIIADGRTLDAREVAEIAMQACDALAAAHAKGIVHRDIKPENLFLDTRSGMRSLKVLDFGISKTALTGTVLSTMLPLVKTQHLMGTPLYMSPEQVRTPDRVDPRTDIWSLGIVMFEALVGDLPIHADSITELCAAILESPLESISAHRNDLPEGFVEVVEKCLEKDVKRRYQNVAELAMALMPYAPKRARICAERASQVLVAAGLVAEENVRFPSSMPPPNSTGPHPIARLSATPGLPSLGFAPSDPLSSRSFAVTSEVPTIPAGADEGDVAVKPRHRKKTLIATVAVVVGLLGAAFAFYSRLSDRGAAGAPPTATNAPTATETAAATNVAPAPAPAPAPEPPKAEEAPKAAPTTPAARPVMATAAPRAPKALAGGAPASRSAATAKTTAATAAAPPSSPAPAPAPAPPKKPDPLDIGY